jgi:predicted phosphoribosyltransferase
MVYLIQNPALRNQNTVFEDRTDAGRRLASFMQSHLALEDPLVCAIPAGGVPIGFELASAYHTRMFLGLVRKLKVPWNPEAGFGSVTWNGEVYLNQELVRLLALTSEDISRAIADTQENIRKRLNTFSRKTPLPQVGGRTVVITDDGLASGYTMLAAAEAIRSEKPEQIIIATPTGSAGAVAVLSGRAEFLVCLNVKDVYPFAVADAYRSWHDLTDDEVLTCLASAGKQGLY